MKYLEIHTQPCSCPFCGAERKLAADQAAAEQAEIVELKEMFLAARPLFDPENGEHERLRLALRSALVRLWTAGAMNDVGMTEEDYANELENFS